MISEIAVAKIRQPLARWLEILSDYEIVGKFRWTRPTSANWIENSPKRLSVGS